MSIPFTQFRRPHGHRVSVTIDRPAEIESMAKEIIAAGFSFEIEELMTGEISMEIYRDRDENSLACEICRNGPQVPDAVDKMTRDGYAAMNATPTPIDL